MKIVDSLGNKLEPVNYKDKTICFYGHGADLALAESMVGIFGRVLYFMPWKDAFPASVKAKIGSGIKGIERIEHFFDYIDQIDIIIFGDIYDGDLQLHLESLGKKVWGSRKAEDLENKRYETKVMMRDKLGMAVQPFRRIVGFEKLCNYLKTTKDQYVKINNYRGDCETWHHENWELSEPKLNEMEYDMGISKDLVEFVIEDSLPNKCEIGYDGWCIDGKYPNSQLCGVEIKDAGYLGKFTKYSDLPKEITSSNDKFAKTLAKLKCRSFVSTEIRVGKDKVPYMIDYTARTPLPPGDIYTNMYSNLADILWFGSQGICIDPITEYKFGLMLIIKSHESMKHWTKISFPPKYKKNVKLKCYIIHNGEYWLAPSGMEEMGSIVCVGNTVEEVIEEAKKIACEVKGYGIECHTHALGKAQEEIKKSEEFGIKLF
jgi:hypothetical protein